MSCEFRLRSLYVRQKTRLRNLLSSVYPPGVVVKARFANWITSLMSVTSTASADRSVTRTRSCFPLEHSLETLHPLKETL